MNTNHIYKIVTNKKYHGEEGAQRLSELGYDHVDVNYDTFKTIYTPINPTKIAPHLLNPISSLKPNIYCKGKDYINYETDITGQIKKEALEVMKIIRLFKQAMAPIRSENMLFLKSPHTFRLKYMHKHETHPYLNSFKECALMSMTVNYTPEQSYSTYDDGVMTAYTMTLQFKELEAVFNDDYGSAKGRTNLNFAVDGESTKFESSSWDPESGISPGYGTEADDPERTSPITGKKQDLSKGGAYI